MTAQSKTAQAKLLNVGSNILYVVAALAVLVAVWEPVSRYVSVGFIPTPLQVVKDIGHDVTQLSTYGTILTTLRRVIIAFVASSLLGVGLGVFMGMRKWFQEFSLPYIVVMLAVPGPVYIIMSLLILGVNEVSCMVALILSVTPFVTNVVYQGTMARDSHLDEMTKHYGIKGPLRLRHVILPQITLSLATGGRTSFALSWKLVALMEALSRADGVGAEITHAFRMLNPSQVVAYTTMFMVVMFAIEFLVFRPGERYMLRWRAQMQ